MGIISRAADLYYTYKFLKTLVTDWEDMEAYKLGVIDDNGKFLLKGKQLSQDQKDSFSPLGLQSQTYYAKSTVW